MKTNVYLKFFLLIILFTGQLFAVTRYVRANSATPVAPYTNWANAAWRIQDAIDVSSAGDEIVVSNGVYNMGGKPIDGYSLTNRVCVEVNLTIRSLNGPQSTIIVGSGPFGSNAVRCVYLARGTLAGFTISNGYTFNVSASFPYWEICGGGVYAYNPNGGTRIITNCVMINNNARLGGGCGYGDYYNCIIKDNFATIDGGGSYYADINDSLISGNYINYSYGHGGGMRYGTAYRCVIVSNRAHYGGGAHSANLYNSLLAHNVAWYGGGARGLYYHVMRNCTIVENEATTSGGSGVAGGVYSYKVYNSVIYDNISDGAKNYYHTTNRYNCTYPMPVGAGNITNEPEFVDAAAGNYRLSLNSPCINAGNNGNVPAGNDLDCNARIIGGTVDIGAYEYLLPIVTITNGYVNVPSNTTSAVIGGTNNQYCVGGFYWTNVSAGTSGDVIRSADSNSWTATIDNLILVNNQVIVFATNIDGRVASDSMIITRGATAVGPPIIDITNSSQTVEAHTAIFTVAGTNNENIIGGMSIENISEYNTTNIDFPAVSSWTAPTVNLDYGKNIITVYGTNALGHVTNDTVTITRSWVDLSSSPVHYVSVGGAHIWPFTNWYGASTNIQLAINTAVEGDLILVSNGVYNAGKYIQAGAASSSRILITNNVTVKSLSGYKNTFIVGEISTYGGSGNTRCARMTAGTLIGFTLTNGFARQNGIVNAANKSGGGVSAGTSAFISNCYIVKCKAYQYGGGAYKGNYYNCLIVRNYCTVYGGGAAAGKYYNCTIANNSCLNYGDGISGYPNVPYLYNCIVYYNGTHNKYGTVHYQYSCTYPMPVGEGNITNEPKFIDRTVRNYHLLADSPCINTGTNSYAPLPFDLDGKPRIIDGTVDMGCYEFLVNDIFITNENFSVDAATTSANIGGTNNSYCAGEFWWTNLTANTAGNVTRSGDQLSWTALIDNLAMSDNFVRVFCTNSLGHLAYDDVIISRGLPPVGDPLVVITSSPATVDYTVENYSIAGTNNEFVTGGMSLINQLNSFSTNFDAEAGWISPTFPLDYGTNTIQISGTNRYGYSSQDTVDIIRNVKVILSNFVSLNGKHIVPFESWEDAATNIQDAIDAIEEGGTVTVSDGVYRIGETITPGFDITNRVFINKNITLQSLNGATSTFIEGAEAAAGGMGAGAIRGVFLSDGTLRGFTIRNCYTLDAGDVYRDRGGAGVLLNYGGLVEDCIFTNNSARQRGGGALCYVGGEINRCLFTKNYSGGGGGGVYCLSNGVVMNSLVINNHAYNNGGGVFCYNGGAVVNCTICHNYARLDGGGFRVQNAAITNSIIYYNTADDEGDNWHSTLTLRTAYCCTVPQMPGEGQISAEPSFVDTNSVNYQINFGSPCRNAGTNQPWMFLPGATDLAGNPRVRDGIVDLGAYETIPEPFILSFIIISIFFLFRKK